MEGLDDKSALTMFIEVLRVGNLYVILKTDTPASYALAIRCANRCAYTEEAVRQKKRHEGSVGAKRSRALDDSRTN